MERVEQWHWSSLGLRQAEPERATRLLYAWPVPVPADWVSRVQEAQTEAELAALRRSVVRGCPYGPESWSEEVARRLSLGHTLRPRGRPKKAAGPGPPEN